MNTRSEEYAYTIGNVVVYAKHIYIARAIAEEATEKCIPIGHKSGALPYQGDAIEWHLIGAKGRFDQT